MFYNRFVHYNMTLISLFILIVIFCLHHRSITISFNIDKNDPVVSFAEEMKGLDLCSYINRCNHNPYMMLYIMLLAEMEGKHSDLSETEKLYRTNIG